MWTSENMLATIRRWKAIKEHNNIKNEDDNIVKINECEELNTINEETKSKSGSIDNRETSSEESQGRKCKREKKKSYRKRRKQIKKKNNTNTSISSGSSECTYIGSSEDDFKSSKSSTLKKF